MRTGSIPAPPQEPVELPGRVKHGGFTAYQRYGCRCLACQTHMRRSLKRYRVGQMGRLPESAKHGRLNTYNSNGCRCEPCKEARRSYDRERWELKRAEQEKGRKR